MATEQVGVQFRRKKTVGGSQYELVQAHHPKNSSATNAACHSNSNFTYLHTQHEYEYEQVFVFVGFVFGL